MASITIRNLDDDVKARLRVRAAEHGRSMEEEAREILRRAVGTPREDIDAWFAALDKFANIEFMKEGRQQPPMPAPEDSFD